MQKLAARMIGIFDRFQFAKNSITHTYLWWATALGPTLQQVKMAKAKAGRDQDATA